MACALTTGYTLGCRTAVGGVEWVAFVPYGQKGTVTSSSGTVTAWSLSSGNFFKYEQEKEVCEFTSTETINEQNGTIFYAQELKLAINGLSAALRQELRLLSQNRLIAIVKTRDTNGSNFYWTLGVDYGLQKSAGVSKSGLAMGDRSGYEQTFTAKETNDILAVSSSVVTSLGL